MSKQARIILIEDNKVSSYNWMILLKFISEDALPLRSGNWQARLQDLDVNDIYAFMIGQGLAGMGTGNVLSDLLDNIHVNYPGIPVLVCCKNEILQALPEQSRESVLQIPEPAAGYQSIINVLHKARQIRGIEAREIKSKLISETGTAMFRSLSGTSKLMQGVRDLLQQLANKKVNVLVTGESGTGKEIVARNLHYHSGRGDKPFITVNCAAIIPEIFDPALYGQEAGHGGQTSIQPGLFERADGGTLFLDKVGDMPLAIQAKILRFLESQRFERLGGTESIKTDVRVIAATHQDLPDRILKREFREDFFYQLSVMPIHLPPLREHAEDIPDLITELLSRLEHYDGQSIRFNSTAILSLQRHHWPGNVRELANLVERLAILYTDSIVGVSDLPVEYQHLSSSEIHASEHPQDNESLDVETDEFESSENGEDDEGDDNEARYKASDLLPMNEENLKHYLKNFEKNLIEVALDDSAGMLKFTAERLAMEEGELQDKIKKHGLKFTA